MKWLELEKNVYYSLAKLDYKRVLWWCCVYGNWNAFINSFAIYERNFKLLNGWFIKSKARCEMTCHYFHGELGDANAQLSSTIISNHLIILSKGYEISSILMKKICDKRNKKNKYQN